MKFNFVKNWINYETKIITLCDKIIVSILKFLDLF